MNLLTAIATEFDIPIIRSDFKVWFVRTNAGDFYHDFFINNYVALGWDKISPEFALDQTMPREKKREIIEDIYPEEKRPGLILGQMEVFYNEMESGDLVVIPSERGKEVAIGKLGEITQKVDHKIDIEEYCRCEYFHKRNVTWIKKVDLRQDIYLFKALRAQQTISDVSECNNLVFRNMFPVYLADDGVHMTLQKETEENMNLVQNYELQANILRITDIVAELYEVNSFKNQISLKTAVGSPGFMEFNFPGIPVAVASAVLLFKLFIGKRTTSDGTTTGLIALIDQINTVINDYHQRKKCDAETDKIKAETRKLDAESGLLLAQTEQIKAETKRGNALYEQVQLTKSGRTNVEEEEENEKINVPAERVRIITKAEEIEGCGEKVRSAAEDSGISVGGNQIRNVS